MVFAVWFFWMKHFVRRKTGHGDLLPTIAGTEAAVVPNWEQLSDVFNGAAMPRNVRSHPARL